MPESFLACKEKHKNGDFVKPEDGYTLGPWVRVRFTNGGNTITVGNRSDNAEDTAVIKSFEFGTSDGLTVKLVVHDQQGGNFALFMDDMLKDSKCLQTASVNMEMTWGWTKTNCPGDMQPNSSVLHYAMPKTVQCNFAGGKFMYTIIAQDIPSRMFEGRTKAITGDDGSPLCFTDAIRKLLIEECGPKVDLVTFRSKDGKDICWKKDDCIKCEGGGSKKGRRDVFESHARDKLQTVYQWLRTPNGITINDRSCVIRQDSRSKKSTVVIQETTVPAPNDTQSPQSYSLDKTYIVNGSKESPVIEFNPMIAWDFFGLQAGTGGEAGTSEPLANQDGGEAPGDTRSATLVKPYVQCVGTEISAAPDRATENAEGPRAERETLQSATQHEKTLQLLHHQIEADLVLIGDPSFDRPIEQVEKTLGIIFVNPFHIRASRGLCGEWLAPPSCNEILSNNSWRLKHITHKIEPGSYTTILRVYLPASGVEVECFHPLGGAGSSGWKPKCC